MGEPTRRTVYVIRYRTLYTVLGRSLSESPLPAPNPTSRRNVLAAALRVADRVGPDGLTMRAVGTEVGLTPMALYRHVDDRAELLRGMAEDLLDELDVPPNEELPWEVRLRSLFSGLRSVAHSHPKTFPLVLMLRRSPRLDRLLLATASAIDDVGVAANYVWRTQTGVWTLLFGFAVRESLGQFRNQPPGGADRHASTVLAAALHLVTWAAADPQSAHPDDVDSPSDPSEDTW